MPHSHCLQLRIRDPAVARGAVTRVWGRHACPAPRHTPFPGNGGKGQRLRALPGPEEQRRRRPADSSARSPAGQHCGPAHSRGLPAVPLDHEGVPAGPERSHPELGLRRAVHASFHPHGSASPEGLLSSLQGYFLRLGIRQRWRGPGYPPEPEPLALVPAPAPPPGHRCPSPRPLTPVPEH